MNTDLKMELFRNKIIETINSCELSISQIYYLLTPIVQEVEKSYKQYAENLIAQYNAEVAASHKEEMVSAEEE